MLMATHQKRSVGSVVKGAGDTSYSHQLQPANHVVNGDTILFNDADELTELLYFESPPVRRRSSRTAQGLQSLWDYRHSFISSASREREEAHQ